MSTFQGRMAIAIARCGNQSELARRASEFAPKPISPQVIQFLASKKPGKKRKPAKGSKLAIYIASASGLNPYWLATGKGIQDALLVRDGHDGHDGAALDGHDGHHDGDGRDRWTAKAPDTDGDSEETTVTLFGMKISYEAVLVAKMFMELPANLRGEYRRNLEIQSMAHSDKYVADGAVATKMANAARASKLAKRTASSKVVK